MSLNIDLPTELERKLEAEARRQGISSDALARIMLEQTLKPEDGNGSSDLPRVVAKNLPIKDGSREVEWLRKNRDEYAGPMGGAERRQPYCKRRRFEAGC